MMGCLLAAVLIVVVLVVVLVFYLANAAGDSGDTDDAAGSDAESSGTDSSTTEPDEEQDSEIDDDALANPVECLPGALDVEIDLAATEVTAGDQIEVPVTVTNTGDVPCLTDTGHDTLEVEVHSGDDVIWASSECPSGAAERALLLDVGDSDSRTITWDGNRGCDGGSAADAGTYRVLASVIADGGEASTEQAFTLN